MNRRTFLRSIAAACGAAVVCPGELLKGKTKREILLEKFRAAALNTKYKNGHPVFIKARQQGCTNSIPYGIPYWIGYETTQT
jgi:hypothetical protein